MSHDSHDSRPTAGDPTAIPVAAALVFHDSRLLITRRPPGTHLAGLWEFPGGKVEPGETWEEALRRELQEELAIDVTPRELFCEVVHRYPAKTVQLRFFVCDWSAGEPTAIGCSEFRWVTRETLDDHEFPPADQEILTRLLQRRTFSANSSKSL